jgi:acyl carrier protein
MKIGFLNWVNNVDKWTEKHCLINVPMLLFPLVSVLALCFLHVTPMLGFSLFFLAAVIIWWFISMYNAKTQPPALTESESDEVGTKVKQCIFTVIGVDAKYMTRQTTFIQDLNIDSLDAVEIIMEIEDEFEITIVDEDVEKFMTVGELIDYVARINKVQNSQVDNGR